MDQALQIPELLTRIVEVINNDYDSSGRTRLTSLARVNSTWREIVQRVLWAEPSVEALASIEKRRRPLYAPYIRDLSFVSNMDPTVHTLFADLQFPRLRDLTLANPFLDSSGHHPVKVFDGWNPTISQYLQPTLEHLRLLLWDSMCTASIFKQITEKCSRLKSICMIVMSTQLQPDEFLSFFQASCHLEHIYLNLGSHLTSCALISSDLLLYLSQMPKLNHLELHNLLDQPELFKRVKEQNDIPFQNLITVLLNAASNVISAATRVLPSVVKLRVFLHDGNGSCFKGLAVMPSLRSLKILGTTATSFTRQELLALQDLNQLERLCILMSDMALVDTMVAPHFTDADFDLLVSGLPELEKFVFDVVWGRRSTSILTSLSNHCPKSVKLRLGGAFDLQSLNAVPKVLFPRLISLVMENAAIQGTPVRLTELQIARLIDNHAPTLQDLTFLADPDLHPVMLNWHNVRTTWPGDENWPRD